MKKHFFKFITIGIVIGIIFGIVINLLFTPVTETVHAEVIKDVLPEEVVVQIEILYSKENKIKIIRETFPEEPRTAVAVGIAESGSKELPHIIQSQHYRNGVQEPSFCTFQIHEPSWQKEAERLGYGDYKTNFISCVKMARHIYDSAGGSWNDWSAYTNGSYKKHL